MIEGPPQAADRFNGVRYGPPSGERRPFEATPRCTEVPPAWPMVALLAPIPLWWLSGLLSLVPIILAIPMVWYLMRCRRLTLPPGCGIWWPFPARCEVLLPRGR